MTTSAPTTPLSPALLIALVKRVREKKTKSRFIGVRSAGGWTGPAKLQVGSEEVAVVGCRSSLALREALQAPPAGEGLVVLVTDRSERDLGLDVVSRLEKRRLWSVDPWPMALDLFGAHSFDPRLSRAKWLPAALVEAALTADYPQVPAGVLAAETAFGALLCARFGFEGTRPDATALLCWTCKPGLVLRFEAAPDEVRSGLREYLVETAGPAGEGILRLMHAGRGEDALPLGLALGPLFATPRSGIAEAALVRLEAWLCGQPLDPGAAQAWIQAAKEVIAAASADPILNRADALLVELKAGTEAHQSDWLPAGFAQRLRRFTVSAQKVLDGRGSPDELERAVTALRLHRGSERQPARLVAVEMAERLVRRGAAPQLADDLAGAVKHHLADSAFVDRARTVLAHGDADAEFAALIRTLLLRAESARERENREFARLLAQATQMNALPSGVLGIEQVLGAVVAPLARVTKVLLLVLDGLSGAIFRELAESLAVKGWSEVVPAGEPERRRILAALPTLTQCSRASLLCGYLTRGDSAVEKKGFAAHPDLLAVTGKTKPPAAFHKAELALGAEAILGGDRRIVAVILNAVDDHLAKHDQISLRWDVDAIAPLGPLLESAREHGYSLIVTSDHGHVLDWGTTLRSHATENARARPDDGTLHDDEVRLEGPRVLAAAGAKVIATWSERVRFGPKQHGYHGGASPAEVVVPLGIFVHGDQAPKGYVSAPRDVPDWWDEVVPAPPAPTPQHGGLFLGNLVDALVQSPTYKLQIRLAARTAPPIHDLKRLLDELTARGGTMTRPALERVLGLAPARLVGLLAAVRRVLNVDGYEVLAEHGADITLQIALLKDQFGLPA